MSEPQQPVPRRRFLRRLAQTAVGGPLLLGVYAWRIEPHWVEVVHRMLPIARLPSALEGQTIAHISDLHVGTVVDNRYLHSALRRVLLAEPAAVFVTGDWMTCRSKEQIANAVQTTKQLQPRKTPVFGILGNHDYAQGFYSNEVATELAAGLRKVGVNLLRNERAEFRGLQIAGIDDLWSRKCRIKKALRGIDSQEAAIVLAHNPDTLDFRGWGDYRGWVLSGHTHGGQCWAPGVGAPIVPVNNKRYVSGEIDLGDGRRVYINRGLGYKHRIRLMMRPEITLMRLTRDDAAA